MADALDPTNITPPRVPLIDDRTGAISREWYRWLLSLMKAIQDSQTDVSALGLGPDLSSLVSSLEMGLAAAEGVYGTFPAAPDLGPVYAHLQALSIAPVPQPYVPSGAQINNVRAITATTSVTGDDYVLLCDATAGVLQVNLPSAAAGRGRTIQVKKVDPTLNYVTIAANGADTIDGGATAVMTTQYEAVTLLSATTNWVII